jgi:DNA-binding response OmpR family regulator
MVATQTEIPSRILVVARPALGRAITGTLDGAGHEVHRTPDAANATGLVRRLRPDLVVIGLDLPWYDGVLAALRLTAGAPEVPLLLVGETSADPRVSTLPRLPSDVDADGLRDAVSELLRVPSTAPRH